MEETASGLNYAILEDAGFSLGFGPNNPTFTGSYQARNAVFLSSLLHPAWGNSCKINSLQSKTIHIMCPGKQHTIKQNGKRKSIPQALQTINIFKIVISF